MPFNWRSPKCPSVYSWDELMQISISSQCGRIIHLKQAPPPGGLERLKDVLTHSKLEKVILLGCFPEAEHTFQMLDAMSNNRSLKKIMLNLHWNMYNDDCITILVDLLSRDVVRSLECPDNLDAVNTERLLEVVTKTEKMKLLNLNGALLNEYSLKFIKEILSGRKISESISMANCKRTCEASLTSEDYESLYKAWEQGNHWYKRNLKVEWFPYVGSIDVNNFSGFKLLFEQTMEHYFNRRTRTKDSSIRKVVRLNTGMAWQLVKPGSKRNKNNSKKGESPKKRQKIDNDLDEIVDMFGTTVGVANPPKNEADREINGVPENNPPHTRWFDSAPGPSSAQGSNVDALPGGFQHTDGGINPSRSSRTSSSSISQPNQPLPNIPISPQDGLQDICQKIDAAGVIGKLSRQGSRKSLIVNVFQNNVKQSSNVNYGNVAENGGAINTAGEDLYIGTGASQSRNPSQGSTL